MENNQLKCGDYSYLFSIRADDVEQHFSQRWPNYKTIFYFSHKKNLEKRFPKETLNVLDAFLGLNVEQFPTNVLSQECTVYRNDEIKLLSDHFQIGNEGTSQWSEFRFEMASLHKKWFSFKSQIEIDKMSVNVL